MVQRKAKEQMQAFKEVIDVAMKFKKVMLSKHLRQAKAFCPRCTEDVDTDMEGSDATLFGSIAGERHHFHMHCTNRCGMDFHE